MKKWSFALAVVALAGCGEESSNQPAAQASQAQPVFSVETTDELVLKALPATRLACPGLNKYSAEFEDVRVEQQYRTTIAFHIPERTATPEAYKAAGHNCFIEIDNDGSAIIVEKQACKSVCLDQLDTPPGQLKLTLASDEEVRRRECLTVFGVDPVTKQTVTLPKPTHCKG